MPLKRMLLFVSLCMLNIAHAVQVHAQADNYMPHPNDKKAAVSQEPMHFFLVFKSHFDIGYSALARDVVHEYRTTMIDKALDVMDSSKAHASNRPFVWTVPAWPLAQMLWDGQDPKRRARIEEAIRNGNLVFHALPVSMHTGTLEVEDLVRGLEFGSALSRQYGKPYPTDSKMTDVPGHSWIIPTLLKNAGITFFQLGANPTNQAVHFPDIFWWEGPDGSRVLTMFTKGYGGGLFPPEGWTHGCWLAIVHAGDNAGPPPPGEVERMISEIKAKYPRATITIGRMSDFATALLAEKPNLPVVRGDVSDSWIHGPMSSPRAIEIARNMRPLEPVADELTTLSRIWGIQSFDINKPLADIYEGSLMFSEHTWGLANQHFVPGLAGKDWSKMYALGLSPSYARMEESWDEHNGYITQARDKLVPILDNALTNLAEHVSVKGFRIVVYNPMPYARSGYVDFAFPFQGTLEKKYIRPADSGESVPLWVPDEGDNNRLGRFLAKDVPALGYRTYVLTDTPPPAEAYVLSGDQETKSIENKWFRVTFDPARGVIKSIIDKSSNKELVDQNAKNGFGQYLYERYSKQESDAYLKSYLMPEYMKSHGPITAKSTYLPDSLQHSEYSPSNTEFSFSTTAFSVTGMLVPASAGVEGQHNAALSVTLYKDEPWLDLKLSVINKPATEIPEAGWLCLPFNIGNPQYHLGMVGSVIDPAKDMIAGSNFGYLWTNSGVTISNPNGQGVGFCSIDAPAIALGETGFMKFHPVWENPAPSVYINLFNNKWNTNFRSFWSGDIQARVRIWAFDHYNTETSLVGPAWEARLPLQSGLANSAAGALPVTKTGLVVSRKGVLVTAFGPNPDGKGTILRLWEEAGEGGPCDVRLPAEMVVHSIQPVNLRGEPAGNPIPFHVERQTNGTGKGASISFNLPAFSPASFVIN